MNTTQTAIENMCRQLLLPIVSLLLRSGMGFRKFADIAKSVYVDVALNEFGGDGNPATVSRAAILTGLARKEVSRQRDMLKNDPDPDSDPNHIHSTARILMGWYTDPDFLDEQGQPLPLVEEGECSFETLYRRYHGSNVPMSATLNELLVVNAIERDDDGILHARSRYYRPDTANPGAIERAGGVVQDLSYTVRHNMYRDDDETSRFEGRAWSARIPSDRARMFREFLETAGQTFLEQIDAWLVENEAGQEIKGCIRLGVGVYEIHSPERAAQRVLASTEPRSMEESS